MPQIDFLALERTIPSIIKPSTVNLQTVNRQPSTVNLQPSNFNHQTVNRQPSTFNHQTFNLQPSTPITKGCQLR